MAENMIKFYRGQLANLPATGALGAMYITTDEGAIYYGTGNGMKRLGDFIQVDAVANLPTDGANASALYYCVAENILAKWNGTEWVQINKQPTADQIKTMISLADYETKSDAADKLAEAKEYADGKFEAVQKEVDDLEKLVGTIPETAEATDIVGYIQEKTAGIATDTALEELTGRVKTAEDDIDAIEASIGTVEEGKTVVGLIETAQAAAEAAQATADEKTTMAEVEAKNYATKDEAQGYADAKDEAIAAAKKAGDDAQDAVDALAGKVGTVGEGETVVGMIEALEVEAGKKVASVTAADASVTVGGTSTAPTVAAKLSADADNALTLAEDGLKVVIPAAAEYSIVKDENAGEYAAVYHLTKGGVNVGAAINIPKDMVVKSGKVENGNIVLVLNDEANTEITIPASSLIEYVTSGSATGDMVVISIDDEHKVTASITDGSITLAKLHTDIQTAIGKAHVHENADVLAGIDADAVAAWNAAEKNAKDHADGLNTAMNARVEALEAIDHEHANKALLDTYTQTEADLADAVAKKHSHANADELDLVAEGDVAKWNAAEGNAKDHADAEIKKLAEGAVADNAAAIADNAEAIALKANAADVYAKTETYTQEEVDAAIEDALVAAMSWGEF